MPVPNYWTKKQVNLLYTLMHYQHFALSMSNFFFFANVLKYICKKSFIVCFFCHGSGPVRSSHCDFPLGKSLASCCNSCTVYQWLWLHCQLITSGFHMLLDAHCFSCRTRSRRMCEDLRKKHLKHVQFCKLRLFCGLRLWFGDINYNSLLQNFLTSTHTEYIPKFQ